MNVRSFLFFVSLVEFFEIALYEISKIYNDGEIQTVRAHNLVYRLINKNIRQ